MCAEVARGFEPPLNGGNPGRQVRTGRTVIVLLAAVGLLAVLSPLAVACIARLGHNHADHHSHHAVERWGDGGRGLGFNAADFTPNTAFPWDIVDDNTENDDPTCAGTSRYRRQRERH